MDFLFAHDEVPVRFTGSETVTCDGVSLAFHDNGFFSDHIPARRPGEIYHCMYLSHGTSVVLDIAVTPAPVFRSPLEGAGVARQKDTTVEYKAGDGTGIQVHADNGPNSRGFDGLQPDTGSIRAFQHDRPVPRHRHDYPVPSAQGGTTDESAEDNHQQQRTEPDLRAVALRPSEPKTPARTRGSEAWWATMARSTPWWCAVPGYVSAHIGALGPPDFPTSRITSDGQVRGLALSRLA